MPRRLTPRSSLEGLRREAKRWLKALRATDPDVRREARARLARAVPDAPAEPTLRDVQHALAREHGLAGWRALRDAVAALPAAAPDAALHELLAAADRGDAEHVAALLDARPELASARGTLPGHTGLRTALHFGVRHEPVVRALLARGADPNVRDEGDDATPLHFAAENGDLAVIRLLVAHGADPVGDGTWHELDVLGWAAVYGASAPERVREVVDYLVAHGARWTVPSAVALGEVATLRALVARAPAELERPLAPPHAGRRPLHLAVLKRRADALVALLDLGADPGARDAAGMTPLDLAALDVEREMVRLLIERGAPVDLPAAVALERADDVERLLRAEPDALRPGNRWGTLIVRAAERAPGRVIETLLRHGADPNVREVDASAVDGASGYTALHAAAFHGNADAVAVLLRHRADPNVRDGRYCSPPAGWAEYAGRRALRDQLLEATVDAFQLVDFDRADRIPAVVRREPWQRDRAFRELAACEARPGGATWWPEPWHTPLAWAVVTNKADAARALLEEGAAPVVAPDGRTLLDLARAAGHDDVAALLERHARESHAARVRRFVQHACPDHDVRGGPAHVLALGTADALLRRHPELARDSLYTAVICGDLAAVERALAERPSAQGAPAADERGGPKGWTPLLYLAFTRLSHPPAVENAVAIARLLLDHGADPNAFFMAGDSRYTPLVGVAGEGEEERPPHPRRDELARLLLERGAEPYDTQVVYDIHFRGDVRWFLELAHEHAVRRGREADWADPEWRMLDMGPYGSGARWHWDVALRHGDLALAEWLLAHGASPHAAPARAAHRPRGTVYDEAVRRGHVALAALLARHGAGPTAAASAPPDGEEALAAACLRLDRDAAARIARAHPEYLRRPHLLVEAARADRAEVVALLLDLGMSPDVASGSGETALHAAAYAGAARVAALLIERGARVDPVDRAHEATPLWWAMWGRRARTTELLARHSRDLRSLALLGDVERVRAVLGAEPALARAGGESTPLMWLPADEERALVIAELLLAHGADPAARRARDGLTAAEIAASRALDAVAALLRARQGD